jgi:hypothetical protein
MRRMKWETGGDGATCVVELIWKDGDVTGREDSCVGVEAWGSSVTVPVGRVDGVRWVAVQQCGMLWIAAAGG